MPKPVTTQPADNKRRHGRIACELLSSTLGEVIDLSASGMKVRQRGRLRLKAGDEVDLTLRILDDRVPVKARVAWTRRFRFFSHDIGLQFVDLSEQAASAINAVARVAQRGCMFSGIEVKE